MARIPAHTIDDAAPELGVPADPGRAGKGG
jgi:hypothetical protein